MADNVSIGKMRWLVELGCKPDTVDLNDLTQVDYNASEWVWCNIEPITGVNILNGEQEEYDARTHLITIRWRADIHDYSHIRRLRLRPDRTEYYEEYQLHENKEVDGRQRFIIITAELMRVYDKLVT